MTTAVPGPCDAGMINCATTRKQAHAFATLVATILGSSLAFIDGSVVNVALPTMQQALGASPAGVQWLVNAYLLPLGALVLLGGAAGDRFGRSRTFILGLAIFTAASLACALAPSLGLLLAGRAVQGVGAALLVPSSLAILGATFSGEARGRAIGTWAAAGAITGALGPVIGGWLVDSVGWRTIFLINLPIAASALWLAFRYVADIRDGADGGLDWKGTALATPGLGLVTWGLTMLSEPRGQDIVVLAAIVAGASLIVLFLRLEAEQGDHAMMPMALFAGRTYVGVTLVTLFLYAALGGLLVLLPYLLIRVGHYPSTAAGAAMLPLPVLIGLGSRTMGRLSERVGPRWPLTIGPLGVAMGFALLVRVGDGHIAYWPVLFPALVVIAAGMAVSVAPLTATVMGAVSAGHAGSAAGVNNAVARVAGLVATALLGLVLTGAAQDAVFVAHFRVAALVGSGLAVLASLSAVALIAPKASAPGRLATS